MHLINPGKWLREMFPEQTKSIGSILIWTIVYFLDLALVFYLATKVGVSFLTLDQRSRSIMIGVLVATAFVLWWIETAAFNRIVSATAKN